MKIAFYGDSLTAGFPGVAFFELLQTALPQLTLLNYGKGGDTVQSLHQRVVKRGLLEPVDLAFLWIGTNDVLDQTSLLATIYSRFQGQFAALTPPVFEERYRALLDLLCPLAQHLITVSPVFVGEDSGSRWNKRLVEMADTIKTLSAIYPNVTYLDLRSVFLAELGAKPTRGYLSSSVPRVILDVLTLRNDVQIDQVSRRRGFHFTLDGVHFNSTGAALVAQTFEQVIQTMDSSG
jgi:lysophospholipase L1-like esterase